MKHILPLVIFSGFLASCAGQSSNPLEKYPGLKISKPSAQTAEVQTIAPADLFDIRVQGSNEINQIQFIEGQSSQTLLKVETKSGKILAYSVEMSDFTSTDRPVLTQTNEANVYSLQWTPPVGITAGQPGKTFTAKFVLTVTNAENKMLNNVVNSIELNVAVNRNNTPPKIGHSAFNAGVDEGQTTPFTVDIEDKGGAGSPRLPEVQITPYIFSNTEAYRANASQYVALDDDESKHTNPEKIGASTYRYYFLLNVDQLPLDRDRVGREIPTAVSVDICFQMRAIGAVGSMSEQVQVCTVARYAAQPPVFVMTPSQLTQVKSGEENLINFKVQVPHSLSVVTLKNITTQLAGLSGQKTMSCDYETADKKNLLICTLKWTPACLKANATKTLALKADSLLGTKTKSTTENLTLNVLAGPNLCVKSKEGVK